MAADRWHVTIVTTNNKIITPQVDIIEIKGYTHVVCVLKRRHIEQMKLIKVVLNGAHIASFIQPIEESENLLIDDSSVTIILNTNTLRDMQSRYIKR